MLPIDVASLQTEQLMRTFETFPITPQIVLEAIRGVREFQLSFWDAQIWASARLNQVPIVFSEDFNSNSSLDGVRFIDPFAADFDLQGTLARK